MATEARPLPRLVIVTLLLGLGTCEVPRASNGSRGVRVNKCCEPDEIYVGRYCTSVARSERWSPLFASEKGDANLQINHTLVVGLPDCGHMQRWPIYHYKGSSDRLRLLPNGVLRHYFDHMEVPGEIDEYELTDDTAKKTLYHDYESGKYCLDRKIDEEVKSEFAYVCAPDVQKHWLTSTEFLMHNVVSPATHSITISCLLVIAIIYFVMPTLRDLTGNIVTTVCMCLIVSQVADMIRLLTVFKSHISLLIAETICYFGMLAAFFWLNSLGFYIWKTFRSRNIFLRITDGKKYCYYGGYAWSCTIILGTLAVFSHFTMDYPDVTIQETLTYDQQREQMGSLGMIIFFVPVAFTIIIDIFFFATTLKRINKMHTYGRIHHKLRHSFRMFFLLLLTMTMTWLFFLSSFSKYEGLVNAHITINAFLGPLVLYTCIFNQKHVSYLIRKTCCYNCALCPSCCKPEHENEWGDEMTAMNSIEYH